MNPFEAEIKRLKRIRSNQRKVLNQQAKAINMLWKTLNIMADGSSKYRALEAENAILKAKPEYYVCTPHKLLLPVDKRCPHCTYLEEQ